MNAAVQVKRWWRARAGTALVVVMGTWATVTVAPTTAHAAPDEPPPSTDVPVDAPVGGDGDLGLDEFEALLAAEQPMASEPIGLLASSTGVRDGATTVLSGGFLAGGRAPAPLTISFADLPAGMTVVGAEPSPDRSPDGRGWSCADATCRYVTAGGDVVPVGGADIVPVLVVLTEPEAAESGSSVTAAFDDLEPISVPLDRPDDASPLESPALGLTVTGVELVAEGAPIETIVTLTSLGDEPMDGAEVVLSGLDLTEPWSATGDGWSCADGICRRTGTIAPYEFLPPITISHVAPELDDNRKGDGDVDVTIDIDATSTSNGDEVDASHRHEIAVVDDVTDTVSVTARFRSPTLLAPASQSVTVTVTPTGTGDLDGEITVTGTAPDGVELDWPTATGDLPWTCDDTSCRLDHDGSLPAGEEIDLVVPVDVTADAEEGVADVVFAASVDGATDPDAGVMSASFVIATPTATELVPSVARADGLPSALTGQIEFSAFAPRDIVITIDNAGSRYAGAGNVVVAEIVFGDGDEVVTAGSSWDCDTGPVPPGGAIRCLHVLDDDLQPGEFVELPLTLAPVGPGISTISMSATTDDDDISDDHAVDAHLVTVADGPVLTVAFDAAERPRPGLTTEISMVIANEGGAAASEQFVVVETPPGADLVATSGDGWNCTMTDLGVAYGTTVCARAESLEPGSSSTIDLSLELLADPGPGAELWAWTDAPGQRHTSGVRDGFRYPLDAGVEATVSAGPDVSVISPVRRSDGTVGPAVVTLHGTVDLTSRADVTWRQRCVTGLPDTIGEDCDVETDPVEWLDEPVRSVDDPTVRLRLPELPARLDAPVPFVFELSAGPAADTVTVFVSSPATDDDDRMSDDSSDDTSDGNDTDAGTDDDGTRPDDTTPDSTPDTTPETTPETQDWADVIAPPQLYISNPEGDVAARDRVTIWAGASSTQPLTYDWEQLAGPPIELEGEPESATRTFTVPDLAPDQESDILELRLTATDDHGQTAIADVSYRIVWPDDGLSVDVADGASVLLAQVAHPVSIGAVAESAGAPYQWAWSDDGSGLLDGTVTDQGSLTFDAPPQPGEATVSVTVTDDFGRTASASVIVRFTAYDPSQLPDDLCAAIDALAAGGQATLTNPDATFVLTIPNASGVGPCDETLDITFADSTARLPGGPSLTGASGRITAVGLTLDGGQVEFPGPWGVAPTPLDSPLGVSFAADAALGAVTGSIAVGGLPYAGLEGWPGAATLLYGALEPAEPVGLRAAPPTDTSDTAVPPDTTVPEPGDETEPLEPLDPGTEPVNPPHPQQAVVLHGGADAPDDRPGRIELHGRIAPDGSADLVLSADGVARIADVDVPLAGTIRSAPDSVGQWQVGGALTATRSLAPGLRLDRLDVVWDGAGVTGSGSATVVAETLTPARIDDPAPGAPVDGPSLALDITFPPTTMPSATVVSAEPWSFTEGGPTVAFEGSASGIGDAFTLTATGALDGWQLARDLQIDDLTVDVQVACSDGCGSSIDLTAVATVLDTAGVELAGRFDLASGLWRLDGAAPSLALTPAVPIDDVDLSVAIDTDGVVSATGAATAALLGEQHDVDLDFGAEATVATAPFGDREPSPGWVFEDTILALATTDTEYDPLAFDGDVTVPLSADVVTGIAEFSLPERYRRSGRLPDEVTHGLATFDVAADGSLDDTVYTLDVAPPDGWFVHGDTDAAVSVQIVDIGYDLTLNGNVVTTHVRGAAVLTTASVVGGPASSLELELSGSLGAATGDGDAVILSAELTPADETGDLADVFGLAGVDADDLAVELTVATDHDELRLVASVTLPQHLADGLGLAGTTYPLAMRLRDTVPCATIDLDPDDPERPAVDIGGRGLVTFEHAAIVIAPDDCATPDGDRTRGAWFVAADADHDPLVTAMGVDPLEIVGATSADAAWFGDVRLDDVTFGFDVTVEDWSTTITGTTTIADQPVEVAAQVGADSGDAIEFTGEVGSLPLGDRTVDDATITITVSSGDGADTAFGVAGRLDILGTPTDIELTGWYTNGEVTQLWGDLDERSFPLHGDDRLDDTLVFVRYDGTSEDPFSIRLAGGALHVTWGDEPLDAAMTSAVVEESALTAAISIATPFDGEPSAALAGEYHLGGGEHAAGDLEFATGDGSTATLQPTLAGLPVTASVGIERIDGVPEGSVDGNVTLGIGDSSAAVRLSGEFDPATRESELGATVESFAMRGLRGELTVAFEPVHHDDGGGSNEVHAATTGRLFDAEVEFATTAVTCAMFWQQPPTLQGEIYRSGDENTWYELTGEVVPVLPDGIEAAVDAISGTGNTREIELTNIVPEHGEPEDEFEEHLGHGLELELGIDFQFLAASIGFAYYPAGCGFSAHGFVMVSSEGGGDAGFGALQGGGATVDLTSFLGSELSSGERLAIAHALETHSREHRYEHASHEAEQRREAAQQRADEATQRRQAAQRRADAAADDLERALAERDAAAAFHDQFRAQLDVQRAAIEHDAASTSASTASSDAREADLEAAQAARETEENEAAAEEIKKAKQVYFRLGFTYCGTCDSPARIEIGGSVTVPVAGPLSATLGVSATIDVRVEPTAAVTDFELGLRGALGVGFHKSLSAAGFGVAVSADFEVFVAIDLGFHGPQRPNTIGITIGFEAKVAVSASAVLVHLHATLASVEGTAKLQFEQIGTSDLYEGHVYLEFKFTAFGFLHLGPFHAKW